MATDNLSYYAAENALRFKIANVSEHELRRALDRASIRESAEFNRVLFEYFGIDELAYTHGKAVAQVQA